MRTFLVGAILLTAVAAIAVFWSFRQWNTPSITAEMTVVIEPHRGSKTILNQLHKSDAIPDPWKILLPLLLDGRARTLKAGEYAFTVGMTPAQIIDKIARGQVVIHKLTIPEGWTMFQVRAALMKEPLLTGTLPATLPEGSIFPDTLHFNRGQSRISLVEKMQQRMRDVVTREWETRAPWIPLKSPEEAIILASVVEKETGATDERAMIAGVFYNRLRIGMRLQSDPTVVYGIEASRGGTPMERPLTSNDLQMDTSYNSYTRDGLPPTPICNPGLAAIQAVLHPSATDALYFVATGRGGHYFSKTLKEHNANIVQYRQTLRASSPR